jgi:PKHD-type hydroxylase
MVHRPIWYLGKVGLDVCDNFIRGFSNTVLNEASMGEASEKKDTNYRNTQIQFAPSNHSIEKILKDFAYEANIKCDWNYIIDQNEHVQFAKYSESHHYSWHTDTFTLGLKDTDRKITVVCLLNEPSEFEGGDFQIRLYQDYTVPLEKGSVVAFPSILEHRVVPIKSGTRYSATTWISGPRFK